MHDLSGRFFVHHQCCFYFKKNRLLSSFRETLQRVKELVHFGGFSDCNFLRRTLVEEFKQMESRYAFLSLARVFVFQLEISMFYRFYHC